MFRKRLRQCSMIGGGTFLGYKIVARHQMTALFGSNNAKGNPLILESINASKQFNFTPKTRQDHLSEVEADPNFDLLVIGAGASGSGTTLASANAGLKTLMIDTYDFSSGTSSKSSKLIHGGKLH